MEKITVSNITALYFSPTYTTRKVVCAIANAIAGNLNPATSGTNGTVSGEMNVTTPLKRKQVPSFSHKDTATVSYSVSLSLFAVVMFASIFGTLVPMTLEKLKIDPAIATGPFISITNDIIGMMLYMGITVLLS